MTQVTHATLSEFLLARVAEDEARARAPYLRSRVGRTALKPRFVNEAARVVAECHAKRRIVGRYEAHPQPNIYLDLCDLALPYADHPRLPRGVEAVKLCIADPPYPPFVGSGGAKNRSSRWYGEGQRSKKDRPADRHPGATEWDDPARHRLLLEELRDGFDGWAIATAPDGIAAYGPLPVECKLMAWVKPNASPGAHRIAAKWEPVIVYPPVGRRSNRGGVGMVSDVLVENAPREGFIGAKPLAWTRWVLDALSYDPAVDVVTDMFHGSGMVSQALAQGTLL